MLSFDEKFYLKAIENAGKDRFLLRLYSNKGNEKALFLLKNQSINSDGRSVHYYSCESDEDSSIFMRTTTDIKHIMKAVSEFSENPPEGDRHTLD